MAQSSSAGPLSPPHQIIQLWLPLAKKGHAGAQFIIGRIYAEGRGTARNSWRAHMWLLRAAEQGNGDAQMYLGLLYARGHGVRRNPSKAALWMQLAARNGIVKAQYCLSKMFAHGFGVQRSYVYAYVWALLAATGGKRTTMPRRAGHERIRALALSSLEFYARNLSKEEAIAGIRIAKQWRSRHHAKQT